MNRSDNLITRNQLKGQPMHQFISFRIFLFLSHLLKYVSHFDGEGLPTQACVPLVPDSDQMTLLDLPPELLIAIGDELYQSQDAVALASTNRALSSIFQPLAYKINVQYENSCALIWAAFSKQSTRYDRDLESS